MREKSTMMEANWLKATLVAPMLYYLHDLGQTSDRKFRLFAVACCRQVWHHLDDERSRKAVEVAEYFADGGAGHEELRQAASDAMSAVEDICTKRGYDIQMVLSSAPFVFRRDLPAAIRWACSAVWTTGDGAERAARAAEGVANRKELTCNSDILRCIIGNPFRPVEIAPPVLAWNDATVPKIAHAIYGERAFDRLPIIADALEEANCGDADILNHCRQPGDHARGCWVIDLLLGRT